LKISPSLPLEKGGIVYSCLFAKGRNKGLFFAKVRTWKHSQFEND
jgi:hypothetical protein